MQITELNEADESGSHDPKLTSAAAPPASSPHRKRSQPLPSEGGVGAPGGGRSQGGSAWGRKTRTPRTTVESIGGADIAAGYQMYLASVDSQQSPEAARMAEDSDPDSPPRDPDSDDPNPNEYGSEDEPPMTYSKRKLPFPGPLPYASLSPSPMDRPVYATTRELLGYVKTPAHRIDGGGMMGPDEELVSVSQAWAASQPLYSGGGASQLPPWLSPPHEAQLPYEMYSGGRDEVPHSADPRDHNQLYSSAARPSNIPGGGRLMGWGGPHGVRSPMGFAPSDVICHTDTHESLYACPQVLPRRTKLVLPMSPSTTTMTSS